MRVCGTPGCPNLTPNAYCPHHTTPPWQGSTRRARLPRNWNRVRATILHRDPTCQACGTAPSTEVDHIQPGDNHHPSNLQGLCTNCHRAKTQAEAAAARR